MIDRQTIEAWADDGAPTMVLRALCKAWLYADLLPQNAGQYRAGIIEPAIDEALAQPKQQEDLKKWTLWLAKILLLISICFTALDMTPIARNTTDATSWGVRSLLEVRSDALTGCQYLTTSRGGLTPRMDGNGRHMGCRFTASVLPER